MVEVGAVVGTEVFVVVVAVARCVVMAILVHLAGVDYVKAINTIFFYSVCVVGE